MADNENATTEQQPQPTGGTTVNVTVQYPGGQKPVKKVTYVLLAFFLGGLGIHNFYAGQDRPRRPVSDLLLDLHSRNRGLRSGHHRALQDRDADGCIVL